MDNPFAEMEEVFGTCFRDEPGAGRGSVDEWEESGYPCPDNKATAPLYSPQSGIPQKSDSDVFRQLRQLTLGLCALRFGKQSLPTCPTDQAEEGVAHDICSFVVDPE